MIKRIRGSLGAKVFLAAAFLLLFCGLGTYFLTVSLVPQTYSISLSNELKAKVSDFVSMLETVSLEDSGTLFDLFLQSGDIESVELVNSKGEYVELPTMFNYGYYEATTYVINAVSEYEGQKTVMESRDFHFAGDNIQYTLFVFGDPQPLDMLAEVFRQLFPMLFAVIVTAALFAALLFSYAVTKPIIRTGEIAEEMSGLSFERRFDEKRTDELGGLQKSLNTLARNLSSALNELRDANTKLREDIEKERALEKRQMEFFSAVSHELKTPLTVIKGQLEGMLLGVGAYRDHQKYLSRSLAAINTLQEDVQHILTVSRLEGAENIEFTEFDIGETIKEYLSVTEDLRVSKSLRLETYIDRGLSVRGDSKLLAMVIENLIDNAIFYSPESNEIFISAKGGETFSFSIENTGVHIPQEELPKIFEAFYRREKSRNRQTGGSGLGLYIAEKILERHGSFCEAVNTERGVRFSFELTTH